jgi:hypothetical protein
MRSRAIRLILGVAALAALCAAGFFVNYSEQQVMALRAAERVFDLSAREVADGLADLRVSQAAYVAAGQGVDFWMPRVAATAAGVTQKVVELRAAASSDATRSALDDASATLAEFSSVDGRARDYLKAGQPLMAADVIFTEGGQTASMATQQVNAARTAEHQAVEAAEYGHRRQEAAALGGAAAITVLALLVLVLLAPESAARTKIAPRAPSSGDDVTDMVDNVDIVLRDAPAPASRSKYVTARPAGPVLRAASQLCTDFGRVNDLEELKTLVGQAANLMDASGLVVWVTSADGVELQPALSHGYQPQVLARMPAIPRSADNAAAAAVRTSQLQIVLARPGSSNGAVVAPLLSPEGCVGALSAEIRGGGETSESVQALAAIFAAQLSGVLHTPASHEQRATGTGTL